MVSSSLMGKRWTYTTWTLNREFYIAFTRVILTSLVRIGSSRLSTEIQGIQGESLRSGGKEIELDHPISRQDYLSGRCFGAHAASNPAPVNTQPIAKFKPLVPKVAMKPMISSSTTKPSLKPRAEPLADVVINLDTEDFDVVDAPLEVARYWTAQWRKPQTRKNKTWDGDAVVSQCGSVVKLFTDAGELLGTTTRMEKLKSGTTLFICLFFSVFS